MPTLNLAVDGVGGIDQFTLDAGATKAIAVALPDDDNTTTITGTINQTQDLTFGTSALLVGASISNVALRIRFKGAIGGTSPQLFIVSVAPSDPTALTVDVAYADVTVNYPLAPNGTAWNKAFIDNMYAQISLDGTAGTIVITSVSAVVTYTPGGYESRLPMMGVS